MQPSVKAPTSTPISRVQQIISKACSQIKFPIPVNQLLQFSADISITHSLNQNIFDTLFALNYQSALKQMADIRHLILQDFKYTITDDICIRRCLSTLEPADFNYKIKKQFLDTLEQYYEFRDDYQDRGEQISECFDDLLLLMMKLSEQYMKSLELTETWKNNLDDQMEVIKSELRGYLAECFYSFKKDLKKKVKKMLNNSKYQPSSEEKVELIRESYKDYKKNLLRELKVSKWLLPQNILENNLEMHEWNLKSQIGRLLHNKHDYVLVTKKKISEIFQQTSKSSKDKASFDFLSDSDRKLLINLLAYCLTLQTNISKQSEQQLRFCLISLETYGFQYQWNKLFGPTIKKVVWQCESQQKNLRTMINLYLFFSQNYTTVKRIFLRDTFRLLDNFKYGYSNFKVLLNLQNRNLPITNQTLNLLRQQKVEAANAEISKYLNRFLMRDQIKVKQRLPYFVLQKISDPEHNSRVITICISGFTSQADVPNQSWRKLIGNTEGQIYSLGWESSTHKQLSSFAWSQLEKLVASQSFFQHPALVVAALAKTVIDSYRFNPFFEAFDHAVFSGELLGRIIMQIFPGYLINLIAFSLGTQLVKQTLKILKANNKLNIINQVILMGGCADKSQLQSIIDKQHLDLTNCYTTNDSILKWLFKICKPFSSPIGRNQVKGAKNINCSKFVNGHAKYRECMDELRKRLELDDDTHYATEI